jgi:hypothetical protein
MGKQIIWVNVFSGMTKDAVSMAFIYFMNSSTQILSMTFEVFTAMKFQVMVFWSVALYSDVPKFTLKMETARSHKMLISYYITTKKSQPSKTMT